MCFITIFAESYQNFLIYVKSYHLNNNTLLYTMKIYSIKPKFQKFLTPVKNLFIKLKIHPTTINLLALIISILGGIALYYSQYYIWLLIFIPVMAFVRTAFNALDGLVARELKVKNQEFGEVLNEFIDRISDVVIFAALLFVSYTNITLAAIAIILVLLNSYLGIIGKAAGGSRQYVGLIGKADRMIYLSIAAVLILIFKNYMIMNYFLIFLIIGTIISMIQRFFEIKKELYK